MNEKNLVAVSLEMDAEKAQDLTVTKKGAPAIKVAGISFTKTAIIVSLVLNIVLAVERALIGFKQISILSWIYNGAKGIKTEDGTTSWQVCAEELMPRPAETEAGSEE